MKPEQLHTFKRRQDKRSASTVPMKPELFAEAEADGLVEGTFNKESGVYDAKLTAKGTAEANKLRRNPRTNLVETIGN